MAEAEMFASTFLKEEKEYEKERLKLKQDITTYGLQRIRLEIKFEKSCRIE